MTAVGELHTYRGRNVDRGPDYFGELRASAELIGQPAALRERFAEDGYLYLPGYLDTGQVLAARRRMLEKLAEEAMLDPGAPLMDGIVREGASVAFKPDLAKQNAPLMTLLYEGRMMALFRDLFDGPVRHFDYTWVRCKGGAGGEPTYPHYDIVYMGRGTDRLVTAWTPLGDVPWEMGGLMLLENSHRLDRLRETYGKYDVDAVCTNREGKPDKTWEGDFGWYSSDAFKLQDELGGRWLSHEYRTGDLLIFCMYLMHGSMDNHTNRVRLSTDSRYLPAAEAADERWMGDDPPAHGPRAKKGYIC